MITSPKTNYHRQTLVSNVSLLFFFVIQDCHGADHEDLPITDDVQNYELISGYQNETHTNVEFRRQLDTCDRQDFVIGVSILNSYKHSVHQ